MTSSGIILRIIGKSSFLKKALGKRIINKIGNNRFSSRLNKFYSNLDSAEKTFFHHLYSKLFRNEDSINHDTKWKLSFLGRIINIPIGTDDTWLSWDTALSILGHDTDVKQFYLKLLQSELRPGVFFDIGANYGTHSIIMESQGVNSHAFEPNIKCQAFFERMLNANRLESKFHNIALGENIGRAQLTFPEKSTWLGSISESGNENSELGNDIVVDIETNTLDAFCTKNSLNPDLIKIDTEGYEIHVLRGASDTLQKFKPILIFETNKAEERTAILKELQEHDYEILSLGSSITRISNEDFISARNNNFLASPIEKIEAVIRLNDITL